MHDPLDKPPTLSQLILVVSSLEPKLQAIGFILHCKLARHILRLESEYKVAFYHSAELVTRPLIWIASPTILPDIQLLPSTNKDL
jgi:hypothetical protein